MVSTKAEYQTLVLFTKKQIHADYTKGTRYLDWLDNVMNCVFSAQT